MTTETLQILLHAPTPAALARARRNAANVLREAPDVSVRILANAGAVAAVLDEPDEAHDRITLVCPNSLKALGRTAAEPLRVLPAAGVLELARMQAGGWRYIRA